MADADARRGRLLLVATVAAVAAAQLAMSWSHLHRQITTDESFTFFAATGGVADLLGACRADPAMAAYYVLAFVVAHLFGSSLFVLRVFTFVVFVGIVFVVCRVAQRRGALWAGAVAMLVTGAAPIMREAVVDARAAVLAALLAVLLVQVLAPMLQRSSSDVGIPALLLGGALVVAVAFTHPSGMAPAGVGLLVLVWGVRRATPTTRLLVAGVALAVLVALAANALQADSADGLVEAGLAGVRSTLDLLWGGNLWVAVATVAAVAAVIIVDSRRQAAAVLPAATAIAWMVLLLAAVPAVTLFVARYLVVAVVLLTLAAVACTPTRWRSGLLAGVAVLGAVGAFIARDHRPGAATRWCTVADIVQRDALAGDVLVFPYGSSITPVMACLGEEASDELFERVAAVPSVIGVERSNPRTMWQLEVAPAELMALAEPSPARVLVMRSGERSQLLGEYFDAVAANGGRCVDDLVDGQGLTVCSFDS